MGDVNKAHREGAQRTVSSQHYSCCSRQGETMYVRHMYVHHMYVRHMYVLCGVGDVTSTWRRSEVQSMTLCMVCMEGAVLMAPLTGGAERVCVLLVAPPPDLTGEDNWVSFPPRRSSASVAEMREHSSSSFRRRTEATFAILSD